MKIISILDGIQNLDIVMPEFQREYVWNEELAKQLIISMYNGYPTGSLLFWETNKPPEIKNNAIALKEIGLTKVILDGQQRLTTIYLFLTGKIPPYYTEKDIEHDPRHLYFNVISESFEYYQKNKMDNNPQWIKIIDFYEKDFIAADITENLNIDSVEKKAINRQIELNLRKLRSIKDVDYPVQTVPTSSTIHNAIAIFDRINSQGTKLKEAELALAHISGVWAKARPSIRKKIDDYSRQNFDFSFDFFSRCIVISLTNSALFSDNSKLDYSKFTKEDYETAFNKVIEAVDELVKILKNDAFISGTDDLTTLSVLYSLVSYLLNNENKMNQYVKNGYIYWLFEAMLWGRYSGQVDQKIDKDVNISISKKDPIIDLISEVEDIRDRLIIRASDIEGNSSPSNYKILFSTIKSLNGKDLISGKEIKNPFDIKKTIKIFEKETIKKLFSNAEEKEIKKRYNEISNRIFVFDSKEGQYSSLVNLNKDFFKGQFVPTDEALFNNPEDFFKKRIEFIVNGINEFLNSFKNKYLEGQTIILPDWKEVIKKGEDRYHEFKAAFSFDKNKNPIEFMKHAVFKAISSMMNTEGGKVFVGVEDNGNVVGIENEYDVKGQDGFRLKFDAIATDLIGRENIQYLMLEISQVENKDVAIIHVQKSKNPVYLKNKTQNPIKEEFFIRGSGASSLQLSLKEMNEYIKNHF